MGTTREVSKASSGARNPRGVAPAARATPEPEKARTRTIAVVNQKGGCGKTTTAVNLGGSLAADGARVLVADMDPQAHASLALGADPDSLEENLYEVLAEPAGWKRLDAVIIEVSKGLDLAPSGIALAVLEHKLASEEHGRRTECLSLALQEVRPRYDYALIDCPPNLGLLTFSALRAAHEVIVPVEMSFFASEGLPWLLETIDLLRERAGHDLAVGILPTLFDGRTRFAREMLGELRGRFADRCFDTVIRSNVKLREAARRRIPISRYAPSANGAADYAALAVEVQAGAHSEVRSDSGEDRTVEHYDLARFPHPFAPGGGATQG